MDLRRQGISQTKEIFNIIGDGKFTKSGEYNKSYNDNYHRTRFIVSVLK